MVGMMLTALGCVAFAVFHPGASAVVGELLVVGAGLGFFTPSNNAAIMGSAPLTQSGAAGGVLNMTRGTGTALGLALTGLVFGLVLRALAELLASRRRAGVRDAVAPSLARCPPH
jgi:hypothetical protein